MTADAPQLELLPCPWPICATSMPMLHELPPDRGPRKWQVMCMGCCSAGPIGFTEQDAATFWNAGRRSVPGDVRAKALEEAAAAILKEAPGNDRGGHYEEAAEIVRALISPPQGSVSS